MHVKGPAPCVLRAASGLRGNRGYPARLLLPRVEPLVGEQVRMLLEAFPADGALMPPCFPRRFPRLAGGRGGGPPKSLTWGPFVLRDGQFPQERLLSPEWILPPGLSGLRALSDLHRVLMSLLSRNVQLWCLRLTHSR